MSNSTSTVKLVKDSPTLNANFSVKKQRIRVTDIILNGQKIKIQGSFRNIAAQLNRYSTKTGVIAEIHITKKGEEKLVLKTSRPKVTLIDSSGALSPYFNQGKKSHIGKLIEVLGINKKVIVQFEYLIHRAGHQIQKKASSLLDTLTLSGKNIAYLNSYSRPFAASQNTNTSQASLPDLTSAREMPLNLTATLQTINENPLGDLTSEEEKVELGFTEEEMQSLKEKMNALMLRALQENSEAVALEAVFRLGTKSITISNKQPELISIIQTKLMESDLGETFLRRKSELIGQKIADSIYAKKSFSSSFKRTYSLPASKIIEAIDIAIEEVKLQEYKLFTNDLLGNLSNKYIISRTDAKIINESIINGLARTEGLSFDDFHHDSKRIQPWVITKILTNYAEQEELINQKKIIITKANAAMLNRTISELTRVEYQVV